MEPTSSKLSGECEKCPYVKDCKNKRMEECAMMEWPPNKAGSTVSLPSLADVQSTLKPEHTVTIDTGECGRIGISQEKMIEELKKKLYKSIFCPLD